MKTKMFNLNAKRKKHPQWSAALHLHGGWRGRRVSLKHITLTVLLIVSSCIDCKPVWVLVQLTYTHTSPLLGMCNILQYQVSHVTH